MKKVLRNTIEIDEELCNGCGECVTGCAEGALQIIDGKAKFVSETFCDGLGACIGECPTGALHIVEREVPPFDEEAVKQHIVEKEKTPLPCGCPSTHIQMFDKPSTCEAANKPTHIESVEEGSFLTHWPIQIKLIPASAPFLKGADLLVLADCTAVAFPTLHRDLMKGKIVMMGCPKFDDVREYVVKFADIFKIAGIKSVTVVVMEVPCCSGMPAIVKKGMAEANKKIPMQEIVLNLRGKILKRS